MGWKDELAPWIVCETDSPAKCRQMLETCDILLSGIRDLDLFEKRAIEGRKTFYCSERWFKPRLGVWRLFKPSYLKMSFRFVRLLQSCDSMYYLPIGAHAARDMTRLSGLMSGDIMCFFKAPDIDFDGVPCGSIRLRYGMSEERTRKYCLDKMRMWGYFVAGCTANTAKRAIHDPLRILWCGRMLKLKNVVTLLNATRKLVGCGFRVVVTLVGNGPDENRLRILSKGLPVTFLPFCENSKIRKLMREHDVFVFPSNGIEGWGAVVNEALLEGMRVLASDMTGSGSVLLPKECQFNPYKVEELVAKIKGEISYTGIGEWTADVAANKILELPSLRVKKLSRV